MIEQPFPSAGEPPLVRTAFLAADFGVRCRRAAGLLRAAPLLVGLLVLLCGGVSAQAAGKRLVAPTGSDLLNNCLGSPCLTVSWAISQAVDGDTVSIAPGAYPEAGTIPARSDLTIAGSDPFDRPVLSGGVQITGAQSNLHLRDLILRGDAAGGSDSVLDNPGHVVTGFALHRVQVDGENVPTRQGVSGGQFGGHVSITRSEFLNIKGGIAFDTRSGAAAADGSNLTSGLFSHNTVRNTTGHVRFQHDSAVVAYPDVTITNNVVDTIGPATNAYGGIFKVVRADTLWFLENSIRDIGPTGLVIDAFDYGAGLIPRAVTLLVAANNTFENNRQGIALLATTAFPAASITGNSFTGNVYGIFLPTTTTSIGPHTLTRNNFTGNSSAAIHNAAPGAGTVAAPANWWGCPAGPPNPPNVGCDTVSAAGVTFAVPLAAAQTLPIRRYVATTGADGGNDCLAPGSPCLTIQHAVNQAYPCDQVQVATGTYNESVSIPVPLRLTGNRGDIAAAGPGPSAPVIDLSPLALTNGFDIDPAIPNVTIEGFTIQGFPDVVPSPGNTGIGIRSYNNTVTPAANLTFRDNKIVDARWAAISAGNEGQSLYHNLDLSFNDIRMAAYSSGVVKNVYGIEAANPLNSRISDNKVDQGFSGIRVSAEEQPGETGMAAGYSDVTRNTVSRASNADVETASFDPVAPFNVGTPVLQELRIVQNNLSNDGVSSLLRNQAIYAAPMTPGQIQYLTVASNNISLSNEKFSDGASVELTDIQGLVLERNTVTVSNPISGRILKITNVTGQTRIAGNIVSLFGAIAPLSPPFRHGLDLFGPSVGAQFDIQSNRFFYSPADAAAAHLSAGIRLRGSLDTTVQLDILCNEITGFNSGIRADTLAVGLVAEVHNNSFFNNKTYGIEAEVGGATINATNNWWGDPAGPLVGPSPGMRDGVTGNVTFAPFLAALPTVCPAQIMTPPTELPIGTYTVDFTWTHGINVPEYSLKVGSTPGGGEYHDETTRTVTGASNASPIEITTAAPHGFLTNDSAFIQGVTGNTAANGTFVILVTSPVTFQLVGSSGNGAYAGGGTAGRANRKVRVSGFPTDGTKVYVRLGSKINGVFQFRDYVYTQLDITDRKAEILLPVPSSTLTFTTQTFVWSAGDNVTEYVLKVGTTGVDSGNIFSGSLGLEKSKETAGLPSDGSTVYVRLSSRIGGVLQHNDYTFTAWTFTPAKAEILSPTPGSTLGSSIATFVWSEGIAVTEYELLVGTGAAGNTDIGSFTGLTVKTQTVTGLPTNGVTVYVRLRSKIGGVFQHNDYTYTAFTTPNQAAHMVTPVPGSTLLSSQVTFNWAAGVGATEYELLVGTTSPGSSNIASHTGLLTTSQLVTGLPTTGGAVHVRLRSKILGVFQHRDYLYTAMLLPVINPAGGSTLVSTTVLFSWTAGIPAGGYTLEVGTGPGLNNLFSKNTGTGTSALVPNLPGNGSTIHVRLSVHNGNATEFTDYTYTAATLVGEPAVLTTPVPASTLASSIVYFAWTTGVNVTQYRLTVGTTAGGSEVFNQNTGLVPSASVSKIPTNGGTIYVRLYSLIGATWFFTDYTFTAASIPNSKAVLLKPVPASTLTGSNATFLWTTGGGVTLYRLWIGTSTGGSNLFNQSTPGTAAAVTGLPTNGSTLYVRLWSLVAGVWDFNDYTLTAATLAPAGGALTTPLPASTFTGSTVGFAWTNGVGATLYRLWVGTTAGGSNLFNQSTAGTLLTVFGLPTNGSPVYVRLWSLVGGVWSFTDYTYTAATLASAPAVLTSPTPGSTLGTLPTPFAWSSGVGVTQYWLAIGTGFAGNTNVFSKGSGTSTTVTVTGLPTGGGTVHVRLWSLIAGVWQFNDYTFTAAP